MKMDLDGMTSLIEGTLSLELRDFSSVIALKSKVRNSFGTIGES